MPMTMLVTRDVADRYAGFLASIMPEVGPGIFVSPNLSRAVRLRIWTVVSTWWDGMPGGSITLIWRDDTAPGQLGILTLGLPPRTLADIDGALLIRRAR